MPNGKQTECDNVDGWTFCDMEAGCLWELFYAQTGSEFVNSIWKALQMPFQSEWTFEFNLNSKLITIYKSFKEIDKHPICCLVL